MASIKNIEKSTVLTLKDEVAYQAGQVVMLHGVLILAEIVDQGVQLCHKEILVFQKQLCPHFGGQPCHSGHILVAAGGKALVLFRRGALDVGVGRHMRQLRGEGDHLVVLLGGCDGVAPKARGREQVFHMAE